MSDKGNIYDRDVIVWPEPVEEPVAKAAAPEPEPQKAYARKRVPAKEE